MKAHELLPLAIAWLRESYPTSIIVPELSVSDWGGALMDVGAITETEIVGIEIKGEGDSPSRLPLQGAVYPRVAQKMWVLPDETLLKRVVKARPAGWGLLWCDGASVREVWTRNNPKDVDLGRYVERAQTLNHLCPASICGTLWADELKRIILENAIPCRRMLCADMTRAIIDHMPVTRLYAQAVQFLRKRTWRKHVYAPPEIGFLPDVPVADEVAA